MYTISTLHDLRQRLGLDEGVDDERLWVALQAASVLVERMTGRTFTPHVGTRDHSVHRIDPSVLLLDERPRCIAWVWVNAGMRTSVEELAQAVRRAGYVPTRIELAAGGGAGDD
jgi:hypothetical protein